MKKWYVLSGILAFLLVVSVAGNLYHIHRVAQLKNEAYETGCQAGYQEGYAEARSYWLDAGYDAGHYDGWWKGYDLGYDEGIDYGRYLAGERPISFTHKMSQGTSEWRDYWRDQGIYDRGYFGPSPN